MPDKMRTTGYPCVCGRVFATEAALHNHQRGIETEDVVLDHPTERGEEVAS